MRTWLSTFTLLGLLALSAPVAAQTCGGAAEWSQNGPAGNASMAISTYDFGALSAAAYFAIGSTLLELDADTGTTVGTFTAGGPIQTAPTVAPLADGNWYVFLSSFDGRVYKLTTAGLASAWPGGVDLRRPGCLADGLNATPAVQIGAYSSSAFVAAHGGKDLVYVITRYGCGTTSANRIYALDAATGATAWTFNADGAAAMDFGSEGCSVDYANDRIYCGTNHPSLGPQSTLWAISTIDGSLVWSTDAGSLQNRPQLGANGRVYVADMSGVVRAYSTGGASIWSSQISASAFLRNLWVEFRGAYADQLLLSDVDGVLYDVVDGGASASTLWSAGNGGELDKKRVVGAAAASPYDGKVYVGFDDGQLRQLSFADGSVEASRSIGGELDLVNDANLASSTLGNIDRVTASAQGGEGVATKRFCIPWSNGSTGS